jgi:predicted chitinase
MVQSAYNAYLGGYISGAEYASYASKTLGIVISDPSAKSNSSSSTKNSSSAGSSSSNISSNKSSSTTKPKDTQQIVPLALNTQPSNYVYEIKKPTTVGDISNDVNALQDMLFDLGYFSDLENDSSRWFGGNTATALIRFQVICMGRSFDSLFDSNNTYIGCDDSTRVRLNEIYKLSDKNRAYYRWDKVNRYRSNYNPAELTTFISNKDIDRVYKNLVTKEQLEQVFKSAKHFLRGKVTNKMVGDLNRVLYTYQITSTELIQYFLAVCVHESRLALTEAGWLSRESQLAYLKNKDYYPYYGAGFIQLTGESNYISFAGYIEEPDIMDIENKEEIPYYVATNYAWDTAGWWWMNGNMNNRIAESQAQGLSKTDIFRKVSNAVSRGPGNYNYSGNPGGWEADRLPRYQEVCKIIK